MRTPNNKPSFESKHRQFKESEALSFATWVLLIISFTLIAYAIYTIQTRIS